MRTIKIIAYFLGVLISFPSCIVVYKFKPQTIEQTTKYNNRRIKIQTLDGNKYKLKWIEEKDENIISIKNTKRVVIDTSYVTQIRVGKKVVSLDSALNHNGNIQIKAANRNHKLLNIELQDDQIIGIKRTGKEIIPVVIPKNQIGKIKVQNKGASATVTVLVGIVVAFGIFMASIGSFIT